MKPGSGGRADAALLGLQQRFRAIESAEEQASQLRAADNAAAAAMRDGTGRSVPAAGASTARREEEEIARAMEQMARQGLGRL